MAKEATKMPSLTERLLKTVNAPGAALITNSQFFQEKDVIPVPIPIMCVAFSGRLPHRGGGFVPGITSWAGPSKHFKTLFCLIQVKAYLDKYTDAVAILYDSEFGSPLSYFESVGIDPERVIHVPIHTIEELRTEMSNQLEEIKRGDHVIMVVDSIGMLASKKETDDAQSGKEAADMTRAKVLKSFFRIVTPHFASKNFPLAVVNHTYQTLEMFSKQVQGGGTGGIYAPDNIFFLGRQQDADGQGAAKELHGYHYVIKVEKSRFVKEQSKLSVTVSFDKGLNYYSGLFDLALEAGWIENTKKGYYAAIDLATGVVGEEKKLSWWDSDKAVDYWEELLVDEKFNDWVEGRFRLGASPILGPRQKATEDA